MNDTKQKTVSFVAILGAFLVVGALVYAMNETVFCLVSFMGD